MCRDLLCIVCSVVTSVRHVVESVVLRVGRDEVLNLAARLMVRVICELDSRSLYATSMQAAAAALGSA